MNIPASIFHRDVFKQATERPHETRLIGRPITDPNQLEEANFLLDHGMTREQMAERDRQHSRIEFEDRAISGLRGDPPDIANTRGLSPKRALFARFVEWRLQAVVALSSLETRKAELEALVEAPKATEAEIQREVHRTAAYLMGREGDGGGSVKRKALDERLASERHTADAAQAAMPELDRQIEIAQLRLAHLNSREYEFIQPAIREIAEEIGLADLYMKKVAELRAILDLVNGLAAVAGDYGYGSGFESQSSPYDRFEQAEAVRLPCPAVEGARGQMDKLMFSRRGNSSVWQQLKQSLLLDPRHNARNFVALPK